MEKIKIKVYACFCENPYGSWEGQKVLQALVA
jgi:hypothetical protein